MPGGGAGASPEANGSGTPKTKGFGLPGLPNYRWFRLWFLGYLKASRNHRYLGSTGMFG